MTPPTEAQLKSRVEKWNLECPEGTEVEYHPVMDKPAHTIHKTRSAAFILSGHSPVVRIDGIPGCVHLDACIPTTPPANLNDFGFTKVPNTIIERAHGFNHAELCLLLLIFRLTGPVSFGEAVQVSQPRWKATTGLGPRQYNFAVANLTRIGVLLETEQRGDLTINSEWLKLQR